MPWLQTEVHRSDSRSFTKRFQEHRRDFKNISGNSKFAQHLHENSHSFGHIKEIMQILHITNKGAMMDTLERFHIHKLTKLGKRINDKNTATQNILFDTLIRHKQKRGHPTSHQPVWHGCGNTVTLTKPVYTEPAMETDQNYHRLTHCKSYLLHGEQHLPTSHI
jgi:hypothetical protein